MTDTEKIELLPCPFCGTAEIRIHEADIDEKGWVNYESGKDYFYCKCFKCACHYGWGTKEEAIKSWNTRKNTQELVVLDEAELYETIVSNFDLNDSDTILNCAGTLSRIICAKFGTPPVPSVEEIKNTLHKLFSKQSKAIIDTVNKKGLLNTSWDDISSNGGGSMDISAIAQCIHELLTSPRKENK